MRTPLFLILLLLCAMANAQEVSVRGLLGEMTDLDRLARKSNPSFKVAQASSYDRASTTSREMKTWFANADNGQYLRTEERDGRKEFVMADLQGPGAVVRVWSANATGKLRFYFDGETTARFEAKTADLLTGKVQPFGEPIAYEAARGMNLYFPFPYARSLKITVDDSEGEKAKEMYYHVGYRTYAPDTRVKTFTAEDLKEPGIARVQRALEAERKPVNPGAKVPWFNLKAGESREIFDSGKKQTSGAIQLLQVRVVIPEAPLDPEKESWESPDQYHNALRTLRLYAEFDGERCIDVPLGDFFGTAPGINPYTTVAMQVESSGRMTSRLRMPYGKSAKIWIRNGGARQVRIEHTVLNDERFRFGGDTYHLRAQWGVEKGFTRPFQDMNFLDVSGEGKLVGTMMHIANPVSAWWGEGDEKVYVDGETFPSTFGTGTEDYYGYAWCSPQLFDRPYHAQPRCDGPANMGHSNVLRFHVIDPIPFEKSLRFDMEKWHWNEVEATYAHTVWWYAKPGSTEPRQVKAASLLPPTIERPKPIPGAIEGEKLQIGRITGGQTEIQSWAGLSSEQQLWWKDAKEGDRLVLRVPVAEAGTYELSGNFCFAKDYGIHRIIVNGQPVGETIDFYSPDLKWEMRTVGVVTLPAGEALIEIQSLGHREGAIPRNMFGLDFFMLKK